MRSVLHKYPAAVYSFLTPVNSLVARANFLAGGEVAFHYSEHFTERKLEKRQLKIATDLAKADLNDTERAYLRQRQKETKFLQVAYRIQANPSSTSDELVRSFRAHTTDLYGAPVETYVGYILDVLERRAQQSTEKQVLWQYIQQRVTHRPATSFHAPSHEVFARYRDLFKAHAAWLYDASDPTFAASFPLNMVLGKSLAKTGVQDDGWRVEQIVGGTHVKVSHRDKKVLVGEHYNPRTRKRRRQIIAHEIYGHVVRNYTRPHRITDLYEAEGVAVLLEQLLEDQFSVKRSLRYLAIAAGWGSLGEPMNFREVYEIVWRAMVVVSSYKVATAQRKAFHECMRAFRGGNPTVAGLVLTKDVAYFEGNLRVWKYLEAHDINAKAFKDLVEGRTILEI